MVSFTSNGIILIAQLGNPPSPAILSYLAQSDFHLFRSLSNNLQGLSFNNNAELKARLDEFFESKLIKLYCRGIKRHVHRWEEVVHKNGEYISE